MTGHQMACTLVGQREKIWSIMRGAGVPLTTWEIMNRCKESKESKIMHIRVEPIRRCLQELRDHHPPLARKVQGTNSWLGMPQRY